MFIIILIYLAQWVGFKRMTKLAKENSTMQMVVSLLLSDWAKGFAALLLLPVVPFYFAIEAVHQSFRRCLRKCGLLEDREDDDQCLTTEAAEVWEYVTSTKDNNFSSILSKSMYFGIGAFVLQVGVSLGLVIFLSWFNEVMEEWSLFAMLVVLFIVEIGLFLFPPVAGPPLYMIAAIGIVPKICHGDLMDPDRFWLGIFWSTMFCWFLKLFAVLLEQMAIGKVFSRNVTVKKFIGVQTPFMKGVRAILSQPGCHLAKVAVLCGGPDWPTSVITGIMDLNPMDMLVGSLPVVIIVLPCCISAAFLLKAGADPDNYKQHKAIADVTLLLAGICSGSANMMACYFVQATVADNREKMDEVGSTWQKDPDEDAVREKVAKDEEIQKVYEEFTNWEHQPWFMKIILVLGSLFSSATILVLLNPVSLAFDKFALTDRVSDLENGLKDIVHPAGYASLVLLAITCVLLLLYHAWCSWVMSGVMYSDEDTDSSGTGEDESDNAILK